MRAKFKGICSSCNETYEKGALIIKDSNGSWIHEKCSQKTTEEFENVDEQPQIKPLDLKSHYLVAPDDFYDMEQSLRVIEYVSQTRPEFRNKIYIDEEKGMPVGKFLHYVWDLTGSAVIMGLSWDKSKIKTVEEYKRLTLTN